MRICNHAPVISLSSNLRCAIDFLTLAMYAHILASPTAYEVLATCVLQLYSRRFESMNLFVVIFSTARELS